MIGFLNNLEPIFAGFVGIGIGILLVCIGFWILFRISNKR